MSLQNRVNPEGEICLAPERGALMGNRGCLHDENRRIVSNSKRDAWVTCLLEFKERKRELMQPGLYTELFFLDEATALAAGHRPCAECRRERYKAFLTAWPEPNAKAGDVDAALKRERSPEARPTISQIGHLPDGVMVKALSSGNFFLLLAGNACQWSFGGYGKGQHIDTLGGPFQVLTPVSTIQAFESGYCPDIHPSALHEVGLR
jgi:hypothetical protein